MSQSAPARGEPKLTEPTFQSKRIPVQVQLDEDLAEWARFHRARTRETVSDLVNRLLRNCSKHSEQPPAA
jgi:hypothetical protein